MIHYTPEGTFARVGLNITLGTWRKPYVTFRWVWYDIPTRMLSSRRFRIRLYQWPCLLWSKGENNVIQSWLWDNDFMVMPRTVLEDESSRMYTIAKIVEHKTFPPKLEAKA